MKMCELHVTSYVCYMLYTVYAVCYYACACGSQVVVFEHTHTLARIAKS